MELVAMIDSVDVVADLCPIRQAEHLSTLLANSQTRSGHVRTVALGELVRIGEGFDRATEFLGCNQVQVLDVVRILWVWICPRWGFGNCGKTIPGKTGVIHTRIVRDVQDAMVYTDFVEAITHVDQCQRCHLFPFAYNLM